MLIREKEGMEIVSGEDVPFLVSVNWSDWSISSSMFIQMEIKQQRKNDFGIKNACKH